MDIEKRFTPDRKKSDLARKVISKIDYFRFYLPFRIKNDIKLDNWDGCMEILRYPDMYLKEGFIPEKGTCIYDIGAQYGDHAILWSKRYGASVFSFEIDNETYEKLKENLIINKAKVSAFNIAVGNGDMMKDRNGEKISTISVDALTKLLPAPDVLKIDVEGGETNVLEGASKTISLFHPRIILEVHSSRLETECNEFLLHKGYELNIRDREYTGPRAEGNEWMDKIQNLFYKYRGDKQ